MQEKVKEMYCRACNVGWGFDEFKFCPLCRGALEEQERVYDVEPPGSVGLGQLWSSFIALIRSWAKAIRLARRPEKVPRLVWWWSQFLFGWVYFGLLFAWLLAYLAAYFPLLPFLRRYPAWGADDWEREPDMEEAVALLHEIKVRRRLAVEIMAYCDGGELMDVTTEAVSDLPLERLKEIKAAINGELIKRAEAAERGAPPGEKPVVRTKAKRGAPGAEKVARPKKKPTCLYLEIGGTDYYVAWP